MFRDYEKKAPKKVNDLLRDVHVVCNTKAGERRIVLELTDTSCREVIKVAQAQLNSPLLAYKVERISLNKKYKAEAQYGKAK